MKIKYKKILTKVKHNIAKYHRYYLGTFLVLWALSVCCIILKISNDQPDLDNVPVFKNKEFVTFKSGLSGFVDGFSYINGSYIYNITYHTNHNLKVKNIVVDEKQLLIDRE